MDLLSVFLIALALSADCFAVALGGCLGTKGITGKVVLRTSLAFGLFQFGMPLAGWLLGRAVVDIIAAYDHWVALGLLVFVGGRMIREAAQSGSQGSEQANIVRLPVLLTLAVATSIDALAVGLSSAFLNMNILSASTIIGMVAFAVTMSGFLIGRNAGRLNGRTAKFIGGLILIGIGVRIFVSHL